MSLINHIADAAAAQHGVDRQPFLCWLKHKLALASGDGFRAAAMETSIRCHQEMAEASEWGIAISVDEAYALSRGDWNAFSVAKGGPR